MKIMKAGALVGAVMYAHLVTGCGSAAPPDGIPRSGSTGTAPSGNVAKSIVVPERPSAPLLFKDPNVSGLRLDVYEIDSNPTVVVRGPIGTALPNLPAGATLAEIYKNLHPNEAVAPSALAPLDARLAPLLKAVAPATLAPATLDPATRTAAKEASIEKDWSAFASYFCVSIAYNRDYMWTVLDCDYVNSDDSDWNGGRVWLGQFWGYGIWQDFPLQRGDAMVQFNNTDYPAEVDFTGTDGNFVGNPIFTGPYSWAWVHNYGPGPYGLNEYVDYYQFNAEEGDPLPQGEIGLTQHRLVPIVK